MSPLVQLGNVPFDLSVLSSSFPSVRHIGEKARRLESDGSIVRLKRGLYVVSSQESGIPLNNFLLANHIYGPSYVSLQTALRYYGLIPEHVFLTMSLATKHSRSFSTPVGSFSYYNCAPEYFSIGVRSVIEDGVGFLVASPEKAVCDLINYSRGVNLRSMKDVEVYFEEDMRIEIDSLGSFKTSILEECAPLSRKENSIRTLIKFIKNERYL